MGLMGQKLFTLKIFLRAFILRETETVIVVRCRDRGRERISSQLLAASAEPDVELELMKP